jgi:hypothetical protein
MNGGKDIRKRNNRFLGIYQMKETVKPSSMDDEEEEGDQGKELEFLQSSTVPVAAATASSGVSDSSLPLSPTTASAYHPTTTTGTDSAQPAGQITKPRGTGPAAMSKRIIYTFDNNPGAMRFPTAASKRSKKNLLFAKVNNSFCSCLFIYLYTYTYIYIYIYEYSLY